MDKFELGLRQFSVTSINNLHYSHLELWAFLTLLHRAYRAGAITYLATSDLASLRDEIMAQAHAIGAPYANRISQQLVGHQWDRPAAHHGLGALV